MRLQVPIYIRDDRSGGDPQWVVRPALHDQPLARHVDIDSALASITQQLRRLLTQAAATDDHETIARLSYDPGLADERVRVSIDLRSQVLAGELMLAMHPVTGGRACIVLDHPSCCFLLPDDRMLTHRAAEALEPVVRRLIAQERDPGCVFASRRGWLSSVDLEIPVEARPRQTRRADPARLAIGGDEAVDGATELERVGVCLGDGREEVPIWGREELRAELAGLMETTERRSVVVLGRPGSGRTALIQSLARLRREQRPGHHCYLLSPGRLIAGMSYVGQWQARVEAICAHASRQDHILYVDDAVGLVRAGAETRGGMGIARMIKPWLEAGRLRLIVESSWREFHVLQELDRAFADLLRPLVVPELGEERTAHALTRLLASLEQDAGCSFASSCLPVALPLARRFSGERVLPGSCADLLRPLASQPGRIDAAAVLRHCSQVTGIPVALLDPQAHLDVRALTERLSSRVRGQPEALHAMVHALTIAKAGIADPGRPLQTLLFMGPTGVGKTACARALAEALFGSPDRLVRFDLNEYSGADAADRLVGDWARPEGALVGAIRRQPFAVVLLDEIEKADHAVFDILLQVLGEARLSDALGRTASFANAVIIMTTNLGARPADASRLGFTAGQEDQGYRDAIEGFFRPEFLARIDQVVPFADLSPDVLTHIVRAQLATIAGLSGLERHHLRLQVEEPVIAHLVERARTDATQGRAVRRLLGEMVLEPLADLIAAHTDGAPGVIDARLVDGTVQLVLRRLAPVAPWAWEELPPLVLADEVAACLALRDDLERDRPPGLLELGHTDDRLALQYALSERVERLRRTLQHRLDRSQRPRSRAGDGPPLVPLGWRIDPAAAWSDWSVEATLARLEPGEAVEADATWIERQLLTGAVGAMTTLVVELDAPSTPEVDAVLRVIERVWQAVGLTVERSAARTWRVGGAGTSTGVDVFVGAHAVVDRSGSPQLWRLRVTGAATAAPAGAADGPIHMLWDPPGGRVVDLRTGLWARTDAPESLWRGWIALHRHLGSA